MTWLALDTATDRASVAVGRGSDVHRAVQDGARRHAGALPRLIEEALSSAGASLADVRGVVLADGPGSFTGLRVGAAVAKALVRSRGLPLFSAPSLLARAWSAAPRDGRLVTVLVDALRGEVYAAAYRLYDDRVETILAPAVLRPELVTARAGAADVVVSSAAAPAQELVRLSGRGMVVTGEAAAADAGALLSLVGLAGGASPVEDAAAWEPAYGRPAEAQARWEEAHGRGLPHQAGTPR